MKKLLLAFVILIVVGCSRRIDNATVIDQGKVQISDSLYLKKISVKSDDFVDNVYFLVNERDEIVSGSTNVYFAGKVSKSVTSIVK